MITGHDLADAIDQIASRPHPDTLNRAVTLAADYRKQEVAALKDLKTAKAYHHVPDVHGTEVEAATLVAPKVTDMSYDVLRLFVEDYMKGPGRGFADFQIAEALNMLPYTAAPRRFDLMKMGWVVNSGRKATKQNEKSVSHPVVWELSRAALDRLGIPVREFS